MQEDDNKKSNESDLKVSVKSRGKSDNKVSSRRRKTGSGFKKSAEMSVGKTSARKKPRKVKSETKTSDRKSETKTSDSKVDVDAPSLSEAEVSLEKKPLIWWRIWEKLTVRAPVVAVLPLHGVIGSTGVTPMRGGGLSAVGLEEQLIEAFKVKGLKAVVLSVNSPGGSPVQSSLIASRIRSLAKENKVEVLTFCQDVAASGGYWLACAGDKIYADKSSIVGSIGVISAGFGFEKMIEKIGVERRIISQGENKSRLDPFKPLDNKDIKHIKGIQKEIHNYFIEYVKERRNNLNASDKKVFSGDFWCGNEALKMGLIDEIGNMHEICRQKFGKKVKFKVIKGKRGWLQGALSSHFTQIIVDTLIDRARSASLWQRFGL